MFKYKKTGAKKDIDIRTYMAEQLFIGGTIETPKEFIIPEDRQPKHIKNQYNVNSCVGCAVASILTVFKSIELGLQDITSDMEVEQSHGYIYGKHRQENDFVEGMFVNSTLKELLKLGTVPQSFYPMNEEMPKAKYDVLKRPDLEKYAQAGKIKSYYKFGDGDLNTRWEKIKQAFVKYQLPMLCISDSYYGGSHAIIIYGYFEEGNRRAFYMQNSWGENWGQEGKDIVDFENADTVYLLLDHEPELPFEDVSKDDWQYKYIKNCFNAGIIQGKSDNVFDKNSFATRSEMCVMYSNLMEKIQKEFDMLSKTMVMLKEGD